MAELHVKHLVSPARAASFEALKQKPNGRVDHRPYRLGKSGQCGLSDFCPRWIVYRYKGYIKRQALAVFPDSLQHTDGHHVVCNQQGGCALDNELFRGPPTTLYTEVTLRNARFEPSLRHGLVVAAETLSCRFDAGWAADEADIGVPASEQVLGPLAGPFNVRREDSIGTRVSDGPVERHHTDRKSTRLNSSH